MVVDLILLLSIPPSVPGKQISLHHKNWSVLKSFSPHHRAQIRCHEQGCFSFWKVPSLKVFSACHTNAHSSQFFQRLQSARSWASTKTDVTRQININTAFGESHLICRGCQQAEHRLIPIYSYIDASLSVPLFLPWRERKGYLLQEIFMALAN